MNTRSVAVERRLLDHHDGVRAVGQRGAGRDFRARAGHDGGARRLARVDALDDSQARGRADAGAGRVRGDDGVAVHRRARERRHVDRRGDVAGRDASGRLVEADPLGARDGHDGVAQPLLRFVEARWST